MPRASDSAVSGGRSAGKAALASAALAALAAGLAAGLSGAKAWGAHSPAEVPVFRNSAAAEGTSAASQPAGPEPPAFPVAPGPTSPQKTFPAAPKGARITPDGWFAPRKRWQQPPELPEKVANAFILPVREPISSGTCESLRRKLQWCRDRQAQLVILDMDTWGGQVHAALDIARMLKIDCQGVYTVCFMRTRALSAGAIIASACNEIVVTSVGTFGDCAPISLGLKLEGVQREKVESLLRMELVESAEMNGYPVALAECMVTIGREAWLVRSVQTQELRYVLKKDFGEKVRSVPGATSQPANPQAEWEVLRVLCSSQELLTLHPRLMLEYGFAERQVKLPPKGPPWGDLIRKLHVVAEPVVLGDAWPDEVVLSRSPANGEAILADAGAVSRPADERARTRPATAPQAVNPDDFPAAPEGARFARVDGQDGWFAPTPRKRELAKLPDKVTKAFIIPIREEITEKLYDALKRKVTRVRAEGAQLVIFDLKTPGGSSRAMDDIVRLVLDDMPGIRTVAYVDPEAFSAGAVISLACQEIVTSPTGVIGDAMPIMIGPSGLVPIPDKERGKIESAVRAEVRTLAENNGYSQALCEGMITITIELWIIRSRKTGELRIVDAAQWRGKAAGAPATTQPSVPAQSDGDWQYVKTFVGPNELVTLTADEAVFAGLARNVFASMSDLEKHYHVVTPATVLSDTWSETLVEFLTSGVVTSILLMGGLVCIYIEMNTPGFGVAGSLAIVCFAILFGSRYLVGMAAWWEIALFVVGLILLALEIFVTPGFGVLGITGIVLCIVALLAMVVPNAPNQLPIPDTALSWQVFRTGAAAMMVGVLGAAVAAVLLARFLPKVPVAGRLVLAPATFVPSPTSDSATINAVRIGDVGTVHSMCRPVGQVRFGDDLVDAMADGGLIPTGTKVRVIKKEGNRVVVTRES